MKKFGNVLWGLVIIGIGLIIGLNSLGITNINIFFSGWWTLFIIIPSFIGLFKKNSKIWSLIWLVVGIVLLMSAQNIISYKIVGKLIFPFILVMIGISLIFKDVINNKVGKKIKELNSNTAESENICATFAGQNVDFNGQEFKGANLDAIFGGVEIDIEKAIISKDIIINANSIFGGIEIKVPKNVNIKVKSTPIFGGVSNKIKAQYNESLPTIYVNSFVMFGGIDII